MSAGGWPAAVNDGGVEAAARALGLSVVRGHGRHLALAPCPACRAATRGSHDQAGPVGITADGAGWRCFRCDARGDATSLVAWLVTGSASPARERWAEVRRACAAAGLCDGAPGAPPPATAAERQATAEEVARPPPRRPPADEVARLWASCAPVTDDDEAAGWLQSRRIDPGQVLLYDLARALPRDARVPRWAWAPPGDEPRGGTWPALGYRLLVPLYDDAGSVGSVRARRVVARDDGRPKAIGPSGCELRGVCMANALGRLMLAGAPLGDGSPCAELLREISARRGASVIVAEGEPDFLTAAAQHSDTDQDAPAVLGIVAGSWTPELAARVPDGCTVCIATDDDAGGEKYAAAIHATLAERQRTGLLKVTRWRAA